MRRGLVLLCILLAIPTASAVSVSGRLEITGELELPKGSSLESDPLALFVRDASRGSDVTGSFPSATIYLFEETYLSANVATYRPSVQTSERHPVWVAHNVALILEPAREGWIGLHAKTGRLGETNPGPSTLQSEDRPSLGNGKMNPDDGNPEQPFYLVRVEGSALVRTSNSWRFDGAGSLKAMGPSVTITSHENVTTIETGEMPDPERPGQVVRRWLTIEFEAGSISAEATEAQVASQTAHATWDGPIRFQALAGEVTGDIRGWAAQAGAQTIDGAFAATLSASEVTDRIGVALSGDLRDSTLVARVNVPSVPADAAPWVGILVLGLAIGGASAAYYVKSKHKPRHHIDVEEYAALADRAADAEDYARASTLLNEARKASPTSLRLALDHAYYVAMSGQPEIAVDLLGDPILRDDTDAVLLLARLQLELGNEEAAAIALTRALAATPLVLLDVENDPTFAPLFGRNDVRAASRQARRRLD